MKSLLAYLLLCALIAVGVLAVVSRGSDPRRHFNQATLGNRVADACKPGRVSDWHVDYQDETLLQVTCYYPNTEEIKVTVVER